MLINIIKIIFNYSLVVVLSLLTAILTLLLLPTSLYNLWFYKGFKDKKDISDEKRDDGDKPEL